MNQQSCLNINSCQNKLDDLILLNKELKSHVIFLSETKIDSSYTNAQVALKGYHTYRMDRKKGGGGLMAYFSSRMVSHRVKLLLCRLDSVKLLLSLLLLN